MAPRIDPVHCHEHPPTSTSVVVIGGGIVGLVAALTLAERGVRVVVIEKGSIAGEQSSRNLGWVRKMGRAPFDVPMAVAADRRWAEMPARVGADVGYRQAGIMYLASSEAELDGHRKWLDAVRALGLDSRLVTPSEIDELVPGGKGHWAGGIMTRSDGRAEPVMAASAIANAAIAKGVIIVDNCAVRSLSRSGGRVTGVVTERGEIGCDHVLLAGGLWSRRFLGAYGVGIPTLPLVASVIRTAPLEGLTELAVGGPNFSFRKRLDGGYTITQRGALDAPILLDHLLLGRHYLPSLRQQRSVLRMSFGADFFRDLTLPRKWRGRGRSAYERVRTMDPRVNVGINEEAMTNLKAAWPVFREAVIEDAWAGMMDITPDSLPVVDAVAALPGLTVASGFSGHGFGTAPAAGELAADLIMGGKPLVDPTPYRLSRFDRRQVGAAAAAPDAR